MVNRKQWTARHNPVLEGIKPESPLTVGNGELAYSVDVTGLQTFYDEYKKETPLCTMAQWGWHTIPADCPRGFYTLDDVVMNEYDYNGRTVTYARTKQPGNEKVFDWLRMNPHKFNLARIGLRFRGREIDSEDIEDIRQELKLYDGYIESRYKLYGKSCVVKTFCDSESDTVAVSIQSELLQDGLTIDMDFPYGSGDITGSDWENEEKHVTKLKDSIVSCTMDGQSYYVKIHVDLAEAVQIEKHRIRIKTDSELVQAAFTFAKDIDRAKAVSMPDLFNNILRRAKSYWNGYWEEGGAIELAGSADKRADELERRIVLSLYLLAVNCAGSEPPQETGLTCNSWFGKAHLEMYFWHLSWAPLWNHSKLLMRSIPWYHKHIKQAQDNAKRNGYKGARWPKMVGCDACDSPSKIAVLLVWQQPHIIMMLELIRKSMVNSERHNENKETANHKIQKFMCENWILIKETARFMADYTVRDESGIYHIVPPVIPVQERHLPEEVLDPSFETAYWKYGLKTAIGWAEYLKASDLIDVRDNVEINRWREVYENMVKPPVAKDVYIAHADCPETFQEKAIDHPSMLQNYGMLPDMGIDVGIMRNTLVQVIDKWDYLTLWGWDFAVIAMTATRLNMPETAINQLLFETNKNCYVESGNNRQISRKDLPLYLPGNGSLLLAAAMMTAGYDGSISLPGYPKDGTWKVDFDGLCPYI
ncbi:MAG: glycoside hydrolase family 65 [Eubacteriales bacterium]|nr:glycoside hydrolase family 65 [Eubacteriales bacterium]